MHTEFGYEETNDDPCVAMWFDTSERESILSDWGVPKLSALDQMESWYAKAHASIQIEVVAETGAQMRFRRLKREWIRGTEKFSMLSQIVLHPAYQQIIAMGPEVIPLILRSLEKELDHWFWALKILNQNLDVAEGATTLEEASASWLAWGRERGYLDQ